MWWEGFLRMVDEIRGLLGGHFKEYLRFVLKVSGGEWGGYFAG